MGRCVEGAAGAALSVSGGSMENKKYGVIYADPPWAYKVWSKKGQGRSAENHYPTMDIADIRALPVGELADKDCALFLWVTFPCLREGLSVLESWGFTYKTVAFVWVKQNKKSDNLFWGLGYWTRANAEICILATKGSPRRMDAGVHQVILSHTRSRVQQKAPGGKGPHCPADGRRPPDRAVRPVKGGGLGRLGQRGGVRYFDGRSRFPRGIAKTCGSKAKTMLQWVR